MIFERAREWGRGRERADTEPGSRLAAIGTEPDAGLELTNHETTAGAEGGRSTH